MQRFDVSALSDAIGATTTATSPRTPASLAPPRVLTQKALTVMAQLAEHTLVFGRNAMETGDLDAIGRGWIEETMEVMTDLTDAVNNAFAKMSLTADESTATTSSDDSEGSASPQAGPSRIPMEEM